MNGEKAFKRFFNGLSNLPKFKKKKNQNVKAYFPKNNKTDWIVERYRIKIPTLKWVRLKEKGYIPINAKVISGTISFIAGRDSLLWGDYTYISNYTNESLTMYQVYIRNKVDKPRLLIINPEMKKPNEKDNRGGRKIFINGNIVCFTVPNENLITRRNGKIAIQGNTKHAMYLIRLLHMGLEILTEGECYTLRPDNNYLLAIRHGEYTLEHIQAEAERLFKLLDDTYVKSELPKAPDKDKINKLLCDMTLLSFEKWG